MKVIVNRKNRLYSPGRTLAETREYPEVRESAVPEAAASVLHSREMVIKKKVKESYGR